MPLKEIKMLYDYVCDNCDYKISDVYQSIKDNALVKCDSCGKDSLRRVIYGGICSSVKNISTIGQLADSNWSKMGSYKRSEIVEKSKSNNSESQAKKSDSATAKEINKMTQEQRNRYIITGEK
jgi:putative FmdB family regulatory protein